MFKEMLIILKEDLSFHLLEDEKELLDRMSEIDKKNVRALLLDKIRCCDLPLDLIEAYLEQEKEQEKLLCFSDSKDIERFAEVDRDLDRKCSNLLIAIIKAVKDNKDTFEILDVSLENAVGIKAK